MRNALISLLLVCSTASSVSASANEAILVSLTGLDRHAVDEIKHANGVLWWLELGDALLLAGREPGALQQHRSDRHVLAELGTLTVDELALHARGCGETLTPVGERLRIWSLGSYDLVRRPRAFAPLPAVNLIERAELGAPEWLPVQPNTVLARLHQRYRDQPLPVDPGIVPIVERVDAGRWFTTVQTLTSWDRSSFSPQLTLARHWIAAEFASLGLEVSEPGFTFTYLGSPVSVANVVGYLEGQKNPEEWIVVGGHYDSRNEQLASPGPTPGADDNASGCSGVIEAARAIHPFRPQRSIVFMCYAGEEQGLHGSHAHVNALSASGQLGRVVAMLNMDMIGWSADANLGVLLETRPGADNEALVELVADAAATYVGPVLETVLAYNSCCSDHMPYINAGRPGLMSIHRGRASTYPHYHRTTDTAQNLGVHAQAIGGAIIRSNVAALAQLSGASDSIFAFDNELP